MNREEDLHRADAVNVGKTTITPLHQLILRQMSDDNFTEANAQRLLVRASLELEYRISERDNLRMQLDNQYRRVASLDTERISAQKEVARLTKLLARRRK